MAIVAAGTRCDCKGACAGVAAYAPGAKGHRYPGRCENVHLERTPFDLPRVTAVLDLVENKTNGAKAEVCQWCAPVYRDPTLKKPAPKRKGSR